MMKKNGEVHPLASWSNQYGHRYVELHDGNNHKKMSIHRIVAETYIPNPHNYPLVRHLDGDPCNNWVGNLAWGTSEDNYQDSVRLGTECHKEVYCYETDTIYRSGVQAAEALGVSKSAITNCCQRKSKSVANGLHVCYLVDKDLMLSDDKWLNQVGNQKPLIAYNTITGESQRFKSRKEATKALGLSDSGISNFFAGRINQIDNYTFVEVEG